jgi:membrane peptidoglycan carboxypeptidase
MPVATDPGKARRSRRLIDNREQVLDPMTAYQITSMMEGVVTRGTLPARSGLNRPVAGKTGTTNEEKDAWFVGLHADLTVGVFIGYDNPRPMGRGATGGGWRRRSSPSSCKARWKAPAAGGIPGAQGMKLIPSTVARACRRRRQGDVIMEAFKPGTVTAGRLFDHRVQDDTGDAITPYPRRPIRRWSPAPAGSTDPDACANHPGAAFARHFRINLWSARFRGDTAAIFPPAGGLFWTPMRGTMRAETQVVVDEIKQAISLLRRHL